RVMVPLLAGYPLGAGVSVLSSGSAKHCWQASSGTDCNTCGKPAAAPIALSIPAMLIFDAHLDLAMNALEWNRDLTRSVEEIRCREQGQTDKRDRGRGTVSL